jgi:hypothetical protein
MAYSKEYLIEQMKERGLNVIKVRKAIRELKTDYYFCKSIGEIGMRGKYHAPCGRHCELYEPRNGKSGCCRHIGFCYEPSESEFILSINGKLIKSDSIYDNPFKSALVFHLLSAFSASSNKP